MDKRIVFNKRLRSSILRTALILFAIRPSIVKAEADKCILTGENQSDVKIVLEKIRPGLARGTVNYRSVEKFSFATGIGNGFGLQYFHLGKLQPADPFGLIKEIVASGRLVTFVGNQVARGTPSDERVKGVKKVLLPSLPMSFFYSLDSKRFNMDEESKAMLNAFEGFFIGSAKCDSQIFPYAWD